MMDLGQREACLPGFLGMLSQKWSFNERMIDCVITDYLEVCRSNINGSVIIGLTNTQR